MNKMLLIIVLCMPFMGGVVYPQEKVTQTEGDRLDRIHDATVRVSVTGGVGTGMVYREDDQNYYILTNQHVVGNSQNVGLEFTLNHYPSPRYTGIVTKRRNQSGIDVAEVRIPKNALPQGIKLPVIPLASSDDPPRELFLVTAGCQAGERPSVQLTLTVRETANLIYYLPTSRPGRSGSALVNREGTRIYGLVAWMTGDRDARGRPQRSEGLAMTAEAIRPFLTGSTALVAFDDFPDNVFPIPLAPDFYVGEEAEVLQHHVNQCPPDSCIDDNCPWDYRYTMTPEMEVRDNPWLKRFGGPVQPSPKADPPPQPRQDGLPNNPWTTPPNPEPPKEEPKPSEPSRPRLLEGDLLSRLFERFDRIEPKIDRLGDKVEPIMPRLDDLEPKIDGLRLGIIPRLDKLDERTNPDSDEEVRRRRLFDRMERIPDKLIGPDDLNRFADRQSDSIIGRVRGLFWALIQPFVWIWWIAVFVAVAFGLNVVMTPILGSNWLGIIVVFVVQQVRRLISAVFQGISAATVADTPKQVVAPKRTRKPRAKKPAGKASE